MKRATITLTDDLEAAVDEYLAGREAAPSLTSLVQAALRRYLKPPGREARTAVAAARTPLSAEDTATPRSEVSEAPALYDLGESGGRLPPGAVVTGLGRRSAGVRLGDLPVLLAGLPRLSEAEAEELAGDLDAARLELARSDLVDPWSRAEAEG